MIFKPIGVIKTPFTEKDSMPIQTKGGLGIEGRVEVFNEYSEGLKDLEGFSHIILFYCFHKSQGFHLLVKPFLEEIEHGVFATRAPRRPNQIGISIVKLIDIKENILTIENVDILNETPLLDIKPYVPEIDCVAPSVEPV